MQTLLFKNLFTNFLALFTKCPVNSFMEKMSAHVLFPCLSLVLFMFMMCNGLPKSHGIWKMGIFKNRKTNTFSLCMTDLVCSSVQRSHSQTICVNKTHSHRSSPKANKQEHEHAETDEPFTNVIFQHSLQTNRQNLVAIFIVPFVVKYTYMKIYKWLQLGMACVSFEMKVLLR